jgi:hypothetical protein
VAAIDEELADVGAERQRARARVLEASAQIAELAQAAIDAGLTKSEIARLAQVSRPALDVMLAKQQRRSRKKR